nr:ABC transporter transmembrane domain-containing protein [Bacillus subtilis]
MWRLLSYVKPYRKTILPLSFLTVLIGTAVKLVIPILIGIYVLDQAITGRNSELLIQLIFIISGLYVLNYAANVLRIRWMNQLGQHVIYDLRQHLFTHVQRLSHRFFDQRSAGSILVRIMNDINSLQEPLYKRSHQFVDRLAASGRRDYHLVYAEFPELTIAIMVTLPIMFFISTSLRKKYADPGKRYG